VGLWRQALSSSKTMTAAERAAVRPHQAMIHEHQRRKSAPISNKTSPVAGKSKGGRCAGSPQSKAVPSCAQTKVKFEDLSELERVKRVRVVTE